MIKIIHNLTAKIRFAKEIAEKNTKLMKCSDCNKKHPVPESSISFTCYKCGNVGWNAWSKYYK